MTRGSPRFAWEAAVRRQVAERVPVDAREGRSRRHVLAALSELADPFDQTSGPTHVTGSAVVVGARGVLLHRHKRLALWLQPGGHLEPGEAPWEAAERETAEETGLSLLSEAGDTIPPLLHLDVHAGGRGHTHLDLRYLLRAGADDEPAPGPGESPDVRWFGWEEAIAVADPGLSGLLEDLRRRLGTDDRRPGRR